MATPSHHAARRSVGSVRYRTTDAVSPAPVIAADRFERLIAAAQHGSAWAWSELLSEYGPPVQAYARSQGIADPEDLLGQVLEGVVRRIGTFRGDERAFRSWVFTVTHSRIIDQRRKDRRRPPIADAEVPEVAVDDDADRDGQLGRVAAMAMLDGLPAKQRDVAALRFVAGLSVEQTAQVLGRRAGAVRVASHRALASLQAQFDERGVTR